jgi:hypothetical protein
VFWVLVNEIKNMEMCVMSLISPIGKPRLASVAAALILILTPAVSRSEKKETLKPDDLPAEIKAAIKVDFPDGKITAAEKEIEGEDPGQFDIELTAGGKRFEVEISPDAKIKEKKEVPAEDEAGEEGQAGGEKAGKDAKKWTDSFQIEKYTFSTTGRNRFFILEPGYQLVLESKDAKVVITVTEDTKKVGDVDTRVVEEYEEEEGKLVEVSRNYFAYCKETGDVFYFGEEVDDYKDGKIVDHGGAWRADEKDSKAGIIMPGRILLGARHYQEISPKAMDRAEIVADDVTFKTPAGEFKNCLRVLETTGLNPKEKEFKLYAPEVGQIQDEDLLLTYYGKAKPGNRPEIRKSE